jgi:hypothetical protein
MRRGRSSIFINAFLDLPQHVSVSHCHYQGVVVSSESTQAVFIVDVHGLRPVKCGQLSRDVWLHPSTTDHTGRSCNLGCIPRQLTTLDEVATLVTFLDNWPLWMKLHPWLHPSTTDHSGRSNLDYIPRQLITLDEVATLVSSLDTWPHWTGRNPYTSTIKTAWVDSEVTTTPWWWQWFAETCWGKSRNALVKILLLPRRICWLFDNLSCVLHYKQKEKIMFHAWWY